MKTIVRRILGVGQGSGPAAGAGIAVIFNKIIEENGYDSYLEIGKGRPGAGPYDKIICRKTSVDIVERFKPDYVMSSEEFFNHMRANKKPPYDFIQYFGKSRGAWEFSPGTWIGSVWKVLVEIQYDPSINVDVVIIRNEAHSVVSEHGHHFPGGFVHGLGVIRKLSDVKLKKKKFDVKFLDYDYYERHKFEMMNIISLPEFFEKYLRHEQHIENSIKHWRDK
jgi:hypothetical protein